MLLTRRLLARLAALLPLTGCDDGWQPEPPVRLPPGLPEGATEPRRWALAGAAGHFLDRPATLRGQPAEAAWAAALVEYLATAFQDGREVDGRHLTRLLREGRTTLRAALRIPPEAPPQAVAEALFAAAAAGRRDDAAAALAPFGATLAGFDPESAALAPLRRALRAARDALEAQIFPR
ncbi:hypothetical protein GCM10011504_28120 [Siccirubricoccus deserti]|uniref:Uncharacterized protein n=1 Tax=Siccirubricoccus deserti TaxID=2013562 RepID=A0A9X0UDA6_9PROT|nr:hypothetical protein [Siccirubricoccus deserti]MBC4016209.1 hypothetical protein [Siccirubricoccus deserti]GGC48051.1 hypothetical protein GCM10011504_28120 [Siccirubricoccus deserti]